MLIHSSNRISEMEMDSGELDDVDVWPLGGTMSGCPLTGCSSHLFLLLMLFLHHSLLTLRGWRYGITDLQ